MAYNFDYKDWIQNKAEELAQEEYGTEFYDLPEATRDIIYNRASELYVDFYADKIDAAYERALDNKLMESIHDN